MKKALIFVVLMLAHLSTYAEGIDLSCSNSQPLCDNCPEYQTLFPVEQFSENTGALDIEADQSEILNEKYFLEMLRSTQKIYIYLQMRWKYPQLIAHY